MQRNDSSTATDATIAHLNSFLRGEISAVETYRQAIAKLADSPFLPQLRECLRSHEMRVDLLSQHVRRLGGEPSEGSGVWGAFARAIEGGAKLFGDNAAIAALEEGEDHGRNDYQRDLGDLDAESRTFVEAEILPEQEETHSILSSIKASLR